MDKQETPRVELLEKSLTALNNSNDFLIKRQKELEETLARQSKLCEKLKNRLRELARKTNAFAAERETLLQQLMVLSQKIDKAHEKVFNTAFTAGIIQRAVLELMNSKSFVWTNFFRYAQRTVFSWSLYGKLHFCRTVMQRIFLKKKDAAPFSSYWYRSGTCPDECSIK